MKTRHSLSLAGLAVITAACATTASNSAPTPAAGASSAPAASESPASTTSGTATASKRVRRTPNAIEQEELRAAAQSNVFDLVSAARPEWLRTAGPTSIYGSSAVVAYLDGTRIGTAAALRQVSTGQAKIVRFYPPTEAQSRFGVGHGSGAIQVETGR